jgi:hypothetical protein
MKIVARAAAISALILGVDMVLAVPPDQIRNSPIPPLQPPQARTTRRLPVQQQTPPAPEATAQLPGVGTAAARVVPPATQNGVSPAGAVTEGNYPQEDEVDYDALRAEIWNSAEMREAREFVMEYAQRSAQSSPQEGRTFLLRLSQLSPDDMRSWLERYEQSRMRLSIGEAAQDNARQLGLENAIERQNETRQAYANINQYQSLAAEWAYPTFDPMTPPRRVAAAATLPGDLPAGDPRNFIRGEEGIDIGAGTSPQDAASAASGGDPSSGAAAAGGGGAASGGGGGPE